MRSRWILPFVVTVSLGCTDDGASETNGDEADTGTGEDTETSDADTDTGTETGMPELVLVSGDAFTFGGPGTMIDGAEVTVLEFPELSTVTDADGHWELELEPSADATFVIQAAGYPTTYTKTFSLPDSGTVEQVSFQVPDDATYDALAMIVDIEVDPTACQLASTVTRVGVSIYDGTEHGEEGAVVTIDPALPAEHGPIYFNANVIPQATLTETSVDGGVLFTNVPVGTYVLHAEKDGVEFVDVTIQCEAGVLVNASPPHGLQAL